MPAPSCCSVTPSCTAAAGAFALINSAGNLSGSLGPGMMGVLYEWTGDYKPGMWLCVAVPILSALSMALLAKSVSRGTR